MVNDAGLLRACRVTKGFNCRVPILLDDETVDNGMSPKRLVAPEVYEVIGYEIDGQRIKIISNKG